MIPEPSRRTRDGRNSIDGCTNRPLKMVPKNFAEHAEKFFAANVTITKQLELASEVRASIEIAHTSEYANWLKAYFDVFLKLLKDNPPMPCQDTGENESIKLRNVIYEILSRLPHNEVLRPYESQLLECTLTPLREENEKNALVCMRIAFDVHRNFRPRSEEKAMQFLQFAEEVFGNIPQTVTEVFGTETDEEGAEEGDEDMKDTDKEDKASTKKARRGVSKEPKKNEVSGEQTASTAANDSATIPALKSFKVCTECPLIVMLLFQLYPSVAQDTVQKLLPVMTKTCSARTLRTAFKESVKLRERFADLKSAQVKTISFITYLVRGHARLVLPYQQEISLAVVDLLKTCPDVLSTRKELLVATRHALSVQNFCRSFFQHLDSLLEEHALLGSGRLCAESLRPLAYSFLAELVHHMRSELTLPQIRKTVHVFSTNMQDERLPLSVQMTCARLMHHLVESIFRRRAETTPGSADEARALLVKILDATVVKFRTLRPRLKTLLKLVEHLHDEKKEAPSTSSASGKDGKDDKNKSNANISHEKEGEKDAVSPSAKKSSKKKAVGKSKKGSKESNDDEDDSKNEEKEEQEVKLDVSKERLKELADTKAIVKTLFIGMKTLLWSVTNFRAQQTQTQK